MREVFSCPVISFRFWFILILLFSRLIITTFLSGSTIFLFAIFSFLFCWKYILMGSCRFMIMWCLLALIPLLAFSFLVVSVKSSQLLVWSKTEWNFSVIFKYDNNERILLLLFNVRVRGYCDWNLLSLGKLQMDVCYVLTSSNPQTGCQNIALLLFEYFSRIHFQPTEINWQYSWQSYIQFFKSVLYIKFHIDF